MKATRMAGPTLLSRWLTLGLGAAVAGFYTLILVLALFNEDAPQAFGWPVMASLLISVVAIGVSWRWAKIGFALLLMSAVGLCVATAAAMHLQGFGLPGLVFSAVYPLPLIILAGLTWADVQ